ncbi:hypothetical protein HKX48_001399 [Thoreauomyces humboldtii]|nr:hypothetical protein HKX48_001399 [Thoreauomyces humboldtii]
MSEQVEPLRDVPPSHSLDGEVSPDDLDVISDEHLSGGSINHHTLERAGELNEDAFQSVEDERNDLVLDLVSPSPEAGPKERQTSSHSSGRSSITSDFAVNLTDLTLNSTHTPDMDFDDDANEDDRHEPRRLHGEEEPSLHCSSFSEAEDDAEHSGDGNVLDALESPGPSSKRPASMRDDDRAPRVSSPGPLASRSGYVMLHSPLPDQGLEGLPLVRAPRGPAPIETTLINPSRRISESMSQQDTYLNSPLHVKAMEEARWLRQQLSLAELAERQLTEKLAHLEQRTVQQQQHNEQLSRGADLATSQIQTLRSDLAAALANYSRSQRQIEEMEGHARSIEQRCLTLEETMQYYQHEKDQVMQHYQAEKNKNFRNEAHFNMFHRRILGLEEEKNVYNMRVALLRWPTHFCELVLKKLKLRLNIYGPSTAELGPTKPI